MSRGAKNVMTLHPQGKAGVNIDGDKYREMKAALLKVIGRARNGVPFGDLAELVEPHLSEEVYGGSSITWYTVTVKLDLEARGILDRIPGVSPQRVRRTR